MANPLAIYYTRSQVDKRLLLTGHSHQAWPDCALEGQIEACEDAFLHCDDKWSKAFEKAMKVKQGYQQLLDDDCGHVALSANTHDLLVRFLSACDFKKRPKIITTTGEFHSLRRQLDRLNETGFYEIIKVPIEPVKEIVRRVNKLIDERTSAVMLSAVSFMNGQIVPHLREILQQCLRFGAYLLIDVYHALGVVPFSLKEKQLEEAFIVGGGYKYCQLGEGNAFLRFPHNCELRPVVTGWFAEWEQLSEKQGKNEVSYAPNGARFEGSTYEPTSHYRAAKVFQFFKEQNLSIQRLRQISQHQMALLMERFDSMDANPHFLRRDTEVPLENHGGFLALNSPYAGQLCASLKQAGVSCDARGEILRLGPAPYLSDRQLHHAMDILENHSLEN